MANRARKVERATNSILSNVGTTARNVAGNVVGKTASTVKRNLRILRKIDEQRDQTGKNRRRGMKNTFKKTKGGFKEKLSATLDFESLTGLNNPRRDKVLKRRASEKKPLDNFEQ
jgi:hypothetical protein